jgi:hypothetical protein
MERLIMKQFVTLIMFAGVISAAMGALPQPGYVVSVDSYVGAMTDPQNDVAVLTDGVVPAVWQNEGLVNYNMAGADTQEIIFDFGSVETIGSAQISYYTYSTYGVEAPALVEFYFSSDGTTYTEEPVTYDEFNTDYVFGDQAPGTQEYGLGENTARYVKVVLTPGGSGNEMVLSEIAFSETVIPVAEPDFTISVASYTATPGPSSAIDNDNDLTNGIMEPSDPYSEDWVGYRTVDSVQQIVFDFGSEQEIGGLKFHFLIVSAWFIEAPESVEFLFSTNGTSFGDSFFYDGFDQTSDGGHTVDLNCPDISARYVKLLITPGTRGENSQSEMMVGEVAFVMPTPENEDPVPDYYTSDPEPNYTAPDETGNDLYDGFLPSGLYDLNWVEYFSEKRTYKFDFNFGRELSLENVGLYYDAESVWGIEAPSQALFMFSSDGETYGSYIFIDDFETADGMYTITEAAAGIKCTHARVIIKTQAPSGVIRLGEILFTEQDAPITYTDISGYSTVFNGDGMDVVDLTDGDTSTAVEYQPGVTGFSVPIIFDLNGPKGIASVNVDYIAGAWGLDLSTVLVEFSEDGSVYNQSYILENIDSTSAGFTDYNVRVGTPGAYGRYVKVTFTTPETGLKLTEVSFGEAGDISYSSNVEPANFSDSGGELVDGLPAEDSFYGEGLVTYNFELDETPELVIDFDLAGSMDVESVGLNYTAWDAWSMTISQISVQFSDDGVNYGDPYVKSDLPDSYGGHLGIVQTPGESGSYVRLSIVPDSYGGTEKVKISEVTFFAVGDMSYTLSQEPLWIDPDLTGRTLIDGYIPVSNPEDPGWIQYDTGDNVTVDISLGDTVELSDVGIAYLGQGTAVGDGWVWEPAAPGSAVIYTSMDGENFTQVGEITDFSDSAEPFTSQVQFYGLSSVEQARFVRVDILHDPADDKPFMIGEIIFEEAGSDTAPQVVCAGFSSFNKPLSITAVFDQDISSSGVTADNFNIEGHTILTAEVFEDLGNCVELTLAEYSNVGDVLTVQYRAIGGITKIWQNSNSFYNVCL